MSSHRTSATTRKDTMVTAKRNGSSSATDSRAGQHMQTAVECEAERRLQVLDECRDGTIDSISDVVVRRDVGPASQLTCSSSCARNTRRQNGTAVFNVVDVEDLSRWSTTVGRVTCDQSQQLSQTDKTSRLRQNAEVITAHCCCC